MHRLGFIRKRIWRALWHLLLYSHQICKGTTLIFWSHSTEDRLEFKVGVCRQHSTKYKTQHSFSQMSWLKISSHKLIAVLAHIWKMYWARKLLATLSLFLFVSLFFSLSSSFLPVNLLRLGLLSWHETNGWELKSGCNRATVDWFKVNCIHFNSSLLVNKHL